MRSGYEGAMPKRSFGLLKEELKKQVLRIGLLIFVAILGTGVGLIQPLLFKALIDTAIPTSDLRLIGLLLVGMVIVPVLGAGLNSANHYLRAFIGEAVAQRLRRDLFNHLLHVRLAELAKFKTGELTSRLTSSCGKIGEVYVADHLLPLLMNAILLVGTLTAMTALSWRLSLLSLLAFPFAYLLTRKTRGHAENLYGEFSNALEAGQSYLHEVFPGLRTVRAFNAEVHEKGRWQSWIERHWRIKARVTTFHELIRTLLPEFINYAAAGLAFGYGAFEIIQGRLTVGSLVAFVAYLPRSYSVLQALLGTQVNLQEARVNAEKVDALFGLDRVLSGEIALSAASSEGVALAFQNVSFDYGRGDFGVQDLTFLVEPGEFIAVVGPSGGGKSTIIDLIMGFYAPRSGTITFDEVDQRDLSLASLRSQIGFVPQDTFLWNDSVSANILYPGRSDDGGRSRQAARAAQIDEFILALPDEYETLVGERGMTLSGGERQRLAIARALLQQPRLLLLDEATSALDALTEQKVRGAIDAARQGRTAIVVAHRLVTVLHADRILVIDQGRLVEMGTLQSLLARRGLFYDLYQAQSFDLPQIAL